MTAKKNSKQPPSSDNALFSLIEKTYAVAINPEKYTEFISTLDLFLEFKRAESSQQPLSKDTEVSRHFNLANEILDQKSDSSDPAYLLETMPCPAWFCNGIGEISYINQDAVNYVGNVSNITNLPISIESLQQLSNALEDVDENNNSHLINITLNDSLNDRLPLIISPWGDNLENNNLILVRIVVIFWPANLSNAIQSSYRLTNAEIDVLEALVKGYSSREIASLRQAKNETIRVQLKSIFRKTGTSSQIDVVRLVTGIVGASNFYSEHKQSPKNEVLIAKSTSSFRDKTQIQLPDGRHMTVHRCGAKHGDSFMYIHGYGDNALLPDNIAQILAENNLLAICPVRCGFGDSSPCPSHSPDVDNILKTTCNDLLFISNYFEISQSVYVGMYTGGIFAYAMAAIYEQCVSGLILITSPILPLTPEETRLVPANYQTHLKAVRSSPNAMRFMIKIFSYLAKTNKFNVIWDVYFKKAIAGTDPDQELFQSHDFKRSFMESIRFVLAQGSEAMFTEWLLLSCPYNPSDLVLEKPILMLRGSDDVFVSQEMVDRREMLYPNVSSKAIEEGGAFLLFQNPREVIKEIAAAVRKNALNQNESK